MLVKGITHLAQRISMESILCRLLHVVTLVWFLLVTTIAGWNLTRSLADELKKTRPTRLPMPLARKGGVAGSQKPLR